MIGVTVDYPRASVTVGIMIAVDAGPARLACSPARMD